MEVSKIYKISFQFYPQKLKLSTIQSFNTIAHRKAKIVYNFGPSECNRVK